jgi:DnaJ like chaperone protein
MGSIGFRELVMLAALIIVLHYSGLWPKVIRGLREIRGERVEPEQPTRSSNQDLEVSFKLLGISPSATWDEIERAYRSKAKVHHPDRGGDQDAMRALNDAYSALKRLRGRD